MTKMPPVRRRFKTKVSKERLGKNKVHYRDGAEGFIQWCEEKVYIPIYPEGSDIAVYCCVGNLPSTLNPETGRSYQDIWEGQKVEIRKCLGMVNGRFSKRLVVFCWPRGEGKSLLACLIQLWKFFNWPKQTIMLGANSKDQIKFVHYDIMRDIIHNSPELIKVVGKRNIQEKEIRLKDKLGNVKSIIRSISSFSGIVSNITGFTFSEIFAMKNPSFFVQLYGSIRNIPNAIGVIDSTVSAKTHILYQLYSNYVQGKSPSAYFSYRYSKNGDVGDYWNPNMTQAQLQDYETAFPFGEFERYFLNLWSAGQQQIFTDEMIEEMAYIGIDGQLLNHKMILEAIVRKNQLFETMKTVRDKGFEDGVQETEEKVTAIDNRITPVSSYYLLNDQYSSPQLCSLDKLMALGNVLETDWLVLAGSDMGDPMAVRGKARTIFTCIAKGLPGSKTNSHFVSMEVASLKFVYIVLHLVNVEGHSVGYMKEEIEKCNSEYDGIDVMCGERYGLWDMQIWCEDRDIEFLPIFPTYDRQKACFGYFYEVVKEGRFKSPPLKVSGTKKEDILKEEMEVFDHDTDTKWFGSHEKQEKYGIQDDSVYAAGWTLYGGREKGPADFRIRKSILSFGELFVNRDVVGAYQ